MSTLSFNQIRIFTALVSLLLSVTAFYIDDIINPDGILYIHMAEAFVDNGLAGIKEYTSYNWPFFAIFIAGLHSLTTLPLELCSNILNSLFFVIFTDTLLLISNKTFINKQNLILAAIFIICFQSFNEYRDYIVRDIGYWAFCSLSLYRFIIFIESPSVRNATIWQLVAIIAILFRVEGVVFLFGLPLYLWLCTPIKQALKSYLQLNYLVIITLVSTTIFAIGQTGLATVFGKLTTVLSYIEPARFMQTLTEKSDIIADQVLNQYSDRFSTLILVSGLITMLIYKLVKALSLPYFALYIASIWNRKIESHPHQKLIIYFVLLNIILLLAFLFHEYFMSKRYVIMAGAGLFLLMLPSLCSYIDRLFHHRSRKTLGFIALLLIIGLVDSMTQSGSKAYIQSTAIWASNNLPEGSRILTNNVRADYYVHKSNPDISHQFAERLQAHLNNNDYLIIVEKRGRTTIKDALQGISLEFIYSEQNKKKDRASVYLISAIP